MPDLVQSIQRVLSNGALDAEPDPVDLNLFGSNSLIEQAQSIAAAAGWTCYETEDGRKGAILPPDLRTSRGSSEGAQRVYIYAARDMIARNRGEQALADIRKVLGIPARIDSNDNAYLSEAIWRIRLAEAIWLMDSDHKQAEQALADVRKVLADNGLARIDSNDDPYLAEAIWRMDSDHKRAVSWWKAPPLEVHSKLGRRQTSPYSRLRRAFVRERWKRHMDGRLPLEFVHGEEAEAAMNKLTVRSSRVRFRADWQTIGASLDRRTAHELELYLEGATVAEMGLKNYLHFQRRWPLIRGLILRHHFPEQ